MKNQYAKFKNPDGTTKHSSRAIRQMTSGILGRFKFSFFTGSYSKYTTPGKILRKKRKIQHASRKNNRRA